MPVRAFAFDLDETLMDCSEQHEYATRHMLLDTGVGVGTVRHVFEGITGLRTRDIVESFRIAAGVDHSLDQLLAARAAAFRDAVEKDPPHLLPGVVQCLDEAAQLGPLVLVTSGHVADVEASLGVTGLRSRFAHIVTGEDVHRPKPDAEPYALAVRRLGVPAADVLVFEDSEKGVRAAQAAGCRVVAVPQPKTTSRESVRNADAVVDTMGEVLPLRDLIRRWV